MQDFSIGDAYIEARIAVLKSNARNGIPKLVNLQQEFNLISEKIHKNKLLDKKNKSLLDKLALKFSGLVHIRKVTADEESQGSEDVIARSGAAMESGNIALAINELQKLHETEREALNSWTKKAKDYADSIDAAEEILQYAIRPHKK